MACTIAIKDLTQAERLEIATSLTISPLPPPANPREKKKLAEPAPPFSFFLPVNGGKDLKIPLFYGTQCFGARVKIGSGAKDCSSDLKVGLALREEQRDVVARATKMLEQTGGSIIGCAPGFGKTIVGTILAHASGYKWAVIVPRATLVDQWVSTFTKIFGDVIAPRIYVPGKKNTSPVYDAIVTLDTRVEKIPQALRDEIGFLIVDEGHMLSTASRVNALLGFTPHCVLVETATLKRDDGTHSMMHALAGNDGIYPEYYKTYTEPVKKAPRTKGKSTYIVVAFDTGFSAVENVSPATGKLDFTGLCSDTAASTVMNKLIIDTVVRNPHRKFIILSKFAAHVDVISKAIEARSVPSDTMSRSKKSHRDVRALVGTMPKIGTGYDQKAFCGDDDVVPADTLILTHTVKKWQAFEQLRGRIMRAPPGVTPIVIVMLPTNRVVTRHLAGLSRWISGTCGTVVRTSTTPCLTALVSNGHCGVDSHHGDGGGAILPNDEDGVVGSDGSASE